MANYLFLYHGGSMPETDEARQQSMKAWTDWFGELGSSVVDAGNPASQTRTVSADGADGSTPSNPPTGYSVIRANDLDGAIRVARGCPVLHIGGTVDVVETIEVM